MDKQVNTEKTVENHESYFRTLTIQHLKGILEYCESELVACKTIYELTVEAIERNKGYKKRYGISTENMKYVFQCEEDIEYWENLKRIWDERLERARSRMRAIYRVMAQKELSHEK